MPKTNTKAVRIAENAQQTSLTPAQKKFNTLIKKIDVQKQLLATWKETVPQCLQEVSAKLNPLTAAYGEHQVELVTMLDEFYLTQKFTTNQQEKIAHMISEICEELITAHGREDLKPLYNRYSGGDFDAEAQAELDMQGEMLKSLLEQRLGVPVDEDFDLSDPEKAAELLMGKIQEHQRQAEEQRSKRKKTAKQLAKEAREAEEQANVSKSIQAVYRQLVAALHPDREQDPLERDRKTELMQKVTVAYGNKDLLQLLELQLSVEQIDQSKINNIAEDRLKHYNKVLQNQLDELQEEVRMMELQLKSTVGLSPYEPLTPKRLWTLLKQDIRTMQEEIASIKHDLRLFRDVKQFRLYLKSYTLPQDDFDPFGSFFSPFGNR